MARVKIVPVGWSRRALLGVGAVGVVAGAAGMVGGLAADSAGMFLAMPWRVVVPLASFWLVPVVVVAVVARLVARVHPAALGIGVVALGVSLGAAPVLVIWAGPSLGGSVFELVLSLLPGLGMLALAGAIPGVLVGVAARLIPPRVMAMVGHPCRACGYDRSGVAPGTACSECGDARPPRTDAPRHRALERFGPSALALVFAAALGVTVLGLVRHAATSAGVEFRRGALAEHGPSERSFVQPDRHDPLRTIDSDRTMVLPAGWPAGWGLAVEIPRDAADREGVPMQIALMALDATGPGPSWWEPPTPVRSTLDAAQADRVRVEGLPEALIELFEARIPEGIAMTSVPIGPREYSMAWTGTNQAGLIQGEPVRIDPAPAFE